MRNSTVPSTLVIFLLLSFGFACNAPKTDGERLLIVLSFSDSAAAVDTQVNLEGASVLLSNYMDAPANAVRGTLTLRSYEAIIYKL